MAGSTTNIDTVVQSQASKEVTINAFFDAASQAATYGRRASTCSGLTWGYYGGNVVKTDGTMALIANGTLTLTASNTNYIVARKSTGAVSVSTATTNWLNQTDYWRLYSVVTGTATVTSYTDARDFTQRPATAALSSGTLAQFAATTSAELAGVISDETGSGALVFATSPTLVTPTLGVATATSVNKVTITAPATGATLTLAEGSTFSTSGAYSVTFTATGATALTLPTTGTLATLAGVEELDNKTLDAAVAKGTWTASGTWTLPAYTLGGDITGNSKNITGLTTLDATSVEVTNLKAADGTAAGTIADSTGVVTLASTVLTTTDINGGTIDGATIGGATPAAGAFTTLSASGNTTLGDAATDTLNVGNGGIIKDASGNVGINVTPSTWTANNFWGFQVGPGASLAGRHVSQGSPYDELYLSANVYYDGGWKRIAEAAATQYYQDAGTHVFRYAPSDTAGSAITWTSVLTISAAGLVTVPGAFTANGNVTLGDAATDTVAIQAGSAALPSLIPNGDPNTGLWFPAADTVAVSTGGSERVRVDSSGNVGIGSTAPASLLEVRGGLTTTGAVLTLGTKETTVVANDVLGRINFYAPLEADGSDAILVGGSIAAVAEDTFSETVNKTSLVFQTGASETATTKMTLDSAGNLSLASGNLVLASGAGIDFSATADGTTMSSELLDDYEEGLVAGVTITCGTSGTVTLDSARDTLAYTKIGSWCHLQGRLIVGSVSSPVGYFKFSLPFTSASCSEDSDNTCATIVLNNTNAALPTNFLAILGGNATEIYVYLASGTGVSSTSANELKASTEITISLSYRTA